MRQLMGTVEEQLQDIRMRSWQEAQCLAVDSRGMEFPLAVLPQVDIPGPSGVWIRNAAREAAVSDTQTGFTFRTRGEGIDP